MSQKARRDAAGTVSMSPVLHLKDVGHDGLLPVVFGIAVGLATAFSMARVVTSMLFEMSPYDPFLTVGSALILLCVGASACLVPAKRAAAVDPMQALRSE